MRLAPALLLLGAAALSACAAVPRSGPQGDAMRAGAAADGAAPYHLRVLDADTVAALSAAQAAEAEAARAAARLEAARPIHGRHLRPGDVVEITIWEAVNGGLFSAAGDTGPRSIALPPQQVDGAGYVTAPYAGRLKAAGRTPAQLSAALVAALEGKAIQPQAIASLRESPGAAVTVVGDAAARPGRVALHGVGERLLDVVAAAGGVKTAAHDAVVRLTRRGRGAAARWDAVLRDPSQNVAMRAGDTIALTAEPRSYAVFGATNRPVLTPFNAASVTLDEALAAAAGLSDQRADPAAVFVIRHEPAAEALGLGRGGAPVVYNLDLSRPEAFFLARGFEMRDKDMIYVANAPMADLRKLFSTIGAFLSPTSQAANLSGL